MDIYTGGRVMDCSFHILTRLNSFKLKHINNGFVSCKHAAFHFIRYYHWTGIMWVIVMFLSVVWTLILTAPIHCRASTGEQVA